MLNRAIFKGNGSLVCSNCKKIIKKVSEFSERELKAFKGELELSSQYCNECKKKLSKQS
jgi:hypothetical protein